MYDQTIRTSRMKYTKEILEIYKAPFSYSYGYIFDANSQMVADDAGEDLEGIVRVRGWGNLTGLGAMGLNPDLAADIQDEIGEMIAEALTNYWNSMEGS